MANPSLKSAPPKARLDVQQLEARVVPAGDGLFAIYFDSPTVADAQNFRGPSVSRVEPTVDFNWKTGPRPGGPTPTRSPPGSPAGCRPRSAGRTPSG